jgi:hypothetical protein
MNVKDLIINLMEYPLDTRVAIKIEGRTTRDSMSEILLLAENKMYGVVLLEPANSLVDIDKI